MKKTIIFGFVLMLLFSGFVVISAPAHAATTQKNIDTIDHLYAAWRFSGADVKDLTGGNLSLTLTGTYSATTGPRSWLPAIKINDAHAHKSISLSGFDFYSISIAAWIRIDSLSDDQDIITFSNDSGNYIAGFVYYAADHSLRFWYWGASTYGRFASVDVSGYVGEWIFVVGTYGSTGGHLYINGEEVAKYLSQNSTYYNHLNGPITNLDIFYDHVNGRQFTGAAAEIAIFNDTLTQHEIAELYETSILLYKDSVTGDVLYTPAAGTNNDALEADSQYVYYGWDGVEKKIAKNGTVELSKNIDKHYGGLFEKDGYLYGAVTSADMKYCYIEKMDKNFTVLQEWNVTDTVHSVDAAEGISALWYMDGYWFLGTSSSNESKDHYILVLNDTFALVRIAAKITDTYGFQDADILYKNYVIVTTHTSDTRIYAVHGKYLDEVSSFHNDLPEGVATVRSSSTSAKIIAYQGFTENVVRYFTLHYTVYSDIRHSISGNSVSIYYIETDPVQQSVDMAWSIVPMTIGLLVVMMVVGMLGKVIRTVAKGVRS